MFLYEDEGESQGKGNGCSDPLLSPIFDTIGH